METKLEERITIRLSTNHSKMLDAIKTIIGYEGISTSEIVRYLIEGASKAVRNTV